jgi:hypothetical protein
MEPLPLAVRLLDGTRAGVSSHHCTNISEGKLTIVEKFSKQHGTYCMSVPDWKDCGWVLEEPQADEIVITPPPADIPKAGRS